MSLFDPMAPAAPAASPFRWGALGQRVDPLADRRADANALITKGTSTAPVQHWAQGVDRVAAALLGGYESGQIDQARMQPLGQPAAPPMAASSTSIDGTQNGGGLFGLAGALNPFAWGQ